MENKDLSDYSTEKSSREPNNEGCTLSLKSIPTSIANSQYEKKNLKTLIQQRVEFLFGADALVEEFRYPRKVNDCNENIASSKLPPSSSNNCESSPMYHTSNDLPVVRHLRPEFRSKLTLRPFNRGLSQGRENVSKCAAPSDIKAQNESCHRSHLVCSDLNARSQIKPEDTVNSLCRQNIIDTSETILNAAGNIVDYKFQNNSCETLVHIDALPQLSDHCNLNLFRTLQPEKQGQCNAIKSKEADKAEVGVVSSTAFHKDNGGVDKTQFSEMNDNKNDEKLSLDSREHEAESVTLVQNGRYFLSLLQSKQTLLLDLSERVDGEVESLLISDVSEEIIGYLRAASGKARLLASQKMEQFKELCTKNIHQNPEEEFLVTNADLQGFWDMIMLQVDHIESLFSEIETLRQNDWKQRLPHDETSPHDKQVPRSNLKTSRRQNDRLQSRPSSSTESKDKRQAQRKLLMEFKRKHKVLVDDKTITSDQIEFFVDKVRKS